MTPLIILAVIAGVPIVLSVLFRVNAVFLFLSVAAGNLMATNLAQDADRALGMVSRQMDTELVGALALQFIPVILTLLLLKKTLPAHKMVLHIVPIVAISVMLAILVLPMLPEDMRSQVHASAYGNLIQNTQHLVVGLAALLTLLLAWFSYRNMEAKHGKRK